MDLRTMQEIDEIISQLSAITRELDSISYGIENEFKGIGASICAKSIENLTDRYKYVKNELSRIR